MRVNRKQKIKLLLGVLLTLYILFVLPAAGLALTAGSKAALIGGAWLVTAAAFWYRRDRL